MTDTEKELLQLVGLRSLQVEQLKRKCREQANANAILLRDLETAKRSASEAMGPQPIRVLIRTDPDSGAVKTVDAGGKPLQRCRLFFPTGDTQVWVPE